LPRKVIIVYSASPPVLISPVLTGDFAISRSFLYFLLVDTPKARTPLNKTSSPSIMVVSRSISNQFFNLPSRCRLLCFDDSFRSLSSLLLPARTNPPGPCTPCPALRPRLAYLSPKRPLHRWVLAQRLVPAVIVESQVEFSCFLIVLGSVGCATRTYDRGSGYPASRFLG